VVGGGALGGVGFLRDPARFQEVEQCIETEEAQHDRIDRGDEGVADDRVELIEAAVDQAAEGGAEDGADQKTAASGTETLPSLRWMTLPMMALAKM